VERRIGRISPSPLSSPARGEERRKMKRLNNTPHPCLLPRGGEGERERDFLKFICEFFNFSLEGKIKF
jgi:hypothetical protein